MEKKMKRIRSTCVTIIIVLLLFYVYVGNIGQVSVSLDQNEGSSTTGELLEGSLLQQTFVSEHSNLVGVSIKLATFARLNPGHVEIGVKESGSNRTIYSATVAANTIVDNDYYKLRFPPIKGSKNNKYYIFLKSTDSKSGQAITAYRSDDDRYADGALYLDGVQQDADAVFQVYYNQTVFTKVFG